MAIYKSSNCSPQLSEIDFDEDNTFSCVVNTSGEPAKAYKLKILSENGDITYYDPDQPTILPVPVQNKDILQIKHVNSDLDPLADPSAIPPVPSRLVNGKNYLWGVRVYNALVGSTAQPNTLVTDGFLVGSTKNVIWSRIPKSQTAVLEQLKYDRYIEFTNISPSRMFKGAKDDEYPLLPSNNYTERQKIDWVTTELGNNEDIVKIETVDPFTYNYIDGVEYHIYQCSDKHTVKNVYVDPNSNINISNYIMIYDSSNDAKTARSTGDTPDNILTEMAPCMQSTSNNGYEARKIGGYSSDTGEIRILGSFKVAPQNTQYYRLFEYDSIEKTYTPIDDEVIETIDTEGASIQVDPIDSHKIGGIPIDNSTYFKTLTNIWDATPSNSIFRLFIQPNINIVSDDTNPDEIVFENGARVNITKKTKTVSGQVVDITFNKLDNTQWLLEWSSADGTYDPNNPFYSGTVPTICQTDYKVYTDFSDTSPYNLFYAREAPILTLQYRNALEEIIPGIYIDSTTFVDADGNICTPSTLYLYYDVENDEYYRYNTSSNTYQLTTDVWYDVIDGELHVKDFREVEFRCLWQNSQDEEMIDPQIKSYQFLLYVSDNDNSNKVLIAQSDEYYNITPSWIFRGLDGRGYYHHYTIQIKVIDEYDKEYNEESGFYIYYLTDESYVPISVELDCDEQALNIEVNSPAYADSVDSGGLETVTSDDLVREPPQVIIGEGKTLNYAKLTTDDIDLSFPATFSLFTQFQITEDFVNSIPVPNSDDGSELPLFEIVHKLDDDGLVLEKFTVKLNSFVSYYVNQGVLHKNNNQYKVKIYRDNDPVPLSCFIVNGQLQDYFNIIINEDDGTSFSTVPRFALQSLTDEGSVYEEVSTLGNPASPSYDVNKRYILYNASIGYGNIVYDAGIYRIIDNGGQKYWEISKEEEYIFLENTNQLSSVPPTTYDDLSVPHNARDGGGSDPDVGIINYVDVDGNGVNVWLDSSLAGFNYNELLYNKFVNFFFKVIVNPDQSEVVTCEVSVIPGGA